MTKWKIDRATLKRPLYLSIVKAIENDIRHGTLSFGDKLPTHRDLAYDLSISVQTISRAYDELARRKLISGEVGRGSYIRAVTTEAQPPYISDTDKDGVVDLSILKPVVDVFHEKALSKIFVELSKTITPQMVSSFRPSNAHEKHRDKSIEWLKLCGLEVAPSSVLLTDGVTPALTIALITAARNGSTLVVEEVTHHTILPLTKYLGINTISIEMDAHGALPDAFDKACLNHEACAIYLGPNGENPWGYVMPKDRRRQIVDVARKYDVYIIENGVLGPLCQTGLAPLASLAPERTFYATSFTKCVMPGLRTGYLVAPDSVMPSVLNRHLILNWMANPINAEIASRWIASGLSEKMVNWQRKTLLERHRLVAHQLPAGSYQGTNYGLHIWIDLPSGWNEQEFVSHAMHRGIAVAPSKPFTSQKYCNASGVRVSVGSSSLENLARGLKVISDLLASTPEPSLLVF